LTGSCPFLRQVGLGFPAQLTKTARPTDKFAPPQLTHTQGSVYRELSQAVTDMENLLALRGARAAVAEAPDAVPLPLSWAPPPSAAHHGGGATTEATPVPVPPAIEFRGVGFSYREDGESDDRTALLRSVSFEVAPGSTVSRVFPSCTRSILTEMHLCHASVLSRKLSMGTGQVGIVGGHHGCPVPHALCMARLRCCV
jgi:ABC-type transport system involved in Fe-S cluster assembly fused permease/ATPase subunit